MKLPVAKPAASKTSLTSSALAGRRASSVLAPWVAGESPVSTDATLGLVQFSGDCDCSKITPRSTIRSMTGVRTRDSGL